MTTLSYSITGHPEIITLIVGEEKIHVSCHKVLLGFFSKFFESALYGNFSEALKSTVTLPDDNIDQVRDFVVWLYSGQTGSSIQMEKTHSDLGRAKVNNRKDEDILGNTSLVYLERLWLLSDKFMAADFTNHIVGELHNRNEKSFDTTWEAEFVYNHTLPGSKLRLFIRDSIAVEGPLSIKRLSQKCYDADTEREDWLDLLAKGGDLVRESVLNGFSHWKEYDALMPWARHNRNKYMEKVEALTPEEWLAKKYPTLNSNASSRAAR